MSDDVLAAMIGEEVPLERQVEHDLSRRGFVLERDPSDRPGSDLSGGAFRIVERSTGRVVQGEHSGLSYGWALSDVVEWLALNPID